MPVPYTNVYSLGYIFLVMILPPIICYSFQKKENVPIRLMFIMGLTKTKNKKNGLLSAILAHMLFHPVWYPFDIYHNKRLNSSLVYSSKKVDKDLQAEFKF